MMKKMTLTKMDIATAVLTAGSMIPGIVVYDRLPERIATHFNMNNQPDGWSGRGFAVFGMPLILTGLHLLCCLITSLDDRTKSSPKASRLVRFATPAIAYFVETAMILYALGKLTDVSTVFMALAALILIVFGNYMPKTRQNSFIGIRTPRTLSDETVWNKTHRLAGFVWTVSGIAMLVLVVLGLYIPALILLLIATLIPIIYSMTL